MKVLVVLGHPETASFNHAIADIIRAGIAYEFSEGDRTYPGKPVVL